MENEVTKKSRKERREENKHKLFLKEVQIRNKTESWAEFSFRSRSVNKYWITMAAVFVPSHNRLFLGASACSPADEFWFERPDAANRALGRARQLATWFFLDKPGWKDKNTLLGSAIDAVLLFTPDLTATAPSVWEQVKAVVAVREATVLQHAEGVAIDSLLRACNRQFPHWRLEVVEQEPVNHTTK